MPNLTTDPLSYPGVLNKLGLNYISQRISAKARLFDMYERYYLGTEYQREFIKRYYRLYANTREFYSLISRAVDLDVELVPGGWLAMSNQEEINAVLDLSNWDSEGRLLVHYGALFGDFYIKVYADPDGAKLQAIDPRGVWLDDEKAIIIRNIVTKEGNEQEHAEIITKDRFTYYIDAKEVADFINPFGFIPVYYGQNKSVGLETGLNTFHNVIEEVNAVNEMVTFLQEQTLRALANQKVITGAEPSQIEFSSERTVFLPQGATIDSLTSSIDVEGTLELIKDIKTEVKESLPELVFSTTKNPNLERPVSSDALQIYIVELAAKIKRMRTNYDRVLTRAIEATRLITGQPVFEVRFDADRPIIDLPNSGVNEEQNVGE